MHSLHLHTRLVQAFRTLGLRASQPQLVNLALLCQGLAVSPTCHLSTLALGLPLPLQRDSLIQRLERCLANPHLSVWSCYAPLVRHLLRQWDGREINLVMDRTDIEDRCSVLLVGAAYRHRLLPLTWDVLAYGATDQERQVALLQRLQPYLPQGEAVRVHLYADAEFRAVKLQRTCRDLKWHWHVGLKGDTLYYQRATGWQSLAELDLQRGQRRYLNGVYLTREHIFGPVNLIAEWAVGQDYPRYWSLDLPADPQAYRRGRKRFWCEPTFRDWKSYGFDLEASQVTQAARLTVLLLGLALTTVWMMHLGDWLMRSGRYREIAPPNQADYSLFRLGRDYVQRCRTLERAVPVGFTVRHGA